jgi:hypothetical protein
MNASAEITYYPLLGEFVPPIREFIDRINQVPGLRVRTSGMSSQVFGEYGLLMETLAREIGISFQRPHSVFILKIINADLDTIES